MSDQSHLEITAAWIGVIGALVGTAIGFGLTAGYEIWKDKRKERVLRHALEEELKSNLRALPAKMDIIRQYHDAIKKNLVLEMQNVPISRSIYDNNLPVLSGFLTAKQRNVLHFIYSYFQNIDSVMNQFGEDVTKATSPVTENVIARYTAALLDFGPLFQTTEKLILSYLNNDPIDVLYLDMSLDELKMARFVTPS